MSSASPPPGDPAEKGAGRDSHEEQEKEEEEEEEDDELIPRFFSFLDFVTSVPNPTIYEYRIIEEIGKGAMSRVYLAECLNSSERCAIKAYNKVTLYKRWFGLEEPPYASVDREIELVTSLNHRYILSILEVIDNPKTNSTLLILPYAPLGNIPKMLSNGTLLPTSIPICFFQVAEALRCIHSQNIVHRDVKPANILGFSDTYFVLSDFSVSARMTSDDELFEDTRGSPAFQSPEECSGELYRPKPADVWGYGVSLYYTVFQQFPFNLDACDGLPHAAMLAAVTEMLQDRPLTFPELPKGVDPQVIPLLEGLLEKDPKKRMTLEEVVKNKFFESAWEIDREIQEKETKLAEGGCI